MRSKPIGVARVFVCLSLAGAAGSLTLQAQDPTFSDVTVHDPSVARDGSTFYVFGSHLASAATTDLLHWTQISTGPTAGNPLAPNPQAEFSEALTWVGSNTFWAPDVIRLADGRYCYYYCVGRLDQPRAALGLAISDAITGPYANAGILLRSGMWGLPSEDGSVYDPTVHPNTVDPAVFFDQAGRLWMVYGSYSGGIFILEMDPATGRQLPGQGYGKKLIGGNHSRIEGPYIIYSPESEYYYLFLSFGGLAADGGYNIRLARSRNPDGPYVDAAGTDLAGVRGAPGTLFDDASIAPHGVKLMGGYQFLHAAGEESTVSRGYVSPGHNSAFFDPVTGKHLLFFHTRFVGRGETHEVRVHQMFVNADDWLVVAPHRYAQETISATNPADVPGDYKLINHGKAIAAEVSASTNITLHVDGAVSGAASGTWQLSADYDATLVLDGKVYHGVFARHWDDDNQAWVLAFSALSGEGVAVWGSKVAIVAPPTIVAHPLSLTQPAGTPASLSVSAGGDGPLSYQWHKDGVAIPGANDASLEFDALQASDAGDYTVLVTGSGGAITSRFARIVVAAPVVGRIINMSIRSTAGIEGNPLIVGFVAAGGGKDMLVRAAGPALGALGVDGTMPDPALVVHATIDGEGRVVGSNDNWGDDGLAPALESAFTSVGAFPFEDVASRDSALIVAVEGGRTAHVNSVAPAQSGVVLVEAYDLAPGAAARLVNVSARNFAGVDDQVLIAGFVIDGNAPKRLLIRGVGPTLLADFDVTGAIADPRLALHVKMGEEDRLVATNDTWADEPGVAAAIAGAGAFPLQPASADAAILVTLPAGIYTAHVSGANGTTGEALVEVYELP